MKYPYSKQSLAILEQADPRLQRVFFTAADYVDTTILEAYRSPEKQNLLLAQGRTTLGGGHSKHNVMPSLAIDACPYYRGFGRLVASQAQIEDIAEATKITRHEATVRVMQQFGEWAGRILQVADELSIPLRWGGRWSHRLAWETKFHDLFHFELEV